jgi:hypothetical protein
MKSCLFRPPSWASSVIMTCWCHYFMYIRLMHGTWIIESTELWCAPVGFHKNFLENRQSVWKVEIWGVYIRIVRRSSVNIISALLYLRLQSLTTKRPHSKYRQLLTPTLSHTPAHKATVQYTALNRCTARPLTESEDTRCCKIQFWPPEDEHSIARKMSKYLM